jgi:hypothetical protein
MTVRQDEANGSTQRLDEAAGNTGAQSPVPSRPRLTRRLMLRGAGAALPAMLTLHSGAALARSSNLISGSGEVGGDGTALCLDDVPPNETIVDLDESGSDIVWEMPERDYYAGAELDGEGILQPVGEPISAADACTQPGPHFYADGGGTYVPTQKLNRGMLVSATAVASFTGRGILNITNI